ncbi:MAG: hypothetical protein HY730_05430 [Candidatus Tectomicrobia bacterium]|uniref:DUF6883 domain-containing protein n=1 Tax=Tectimicrobiota bacterium TaxID=2528274 RepID=A0A933GL00_UNCTE|nr:hypothetical protein [Candidatus Tectomicrobia bacterium]
MKLSKDTVISDEKLTKYLLTPRKRNDKSKWLAQAGYTLKNWQSLKNDLRNLILSKNASLIEGTAYGNMYEIRAGLIGPNGKSLPVCTVWMVEKVTEITKFITMYPAKR